MAGGSHTPLLPLSRLAGASFMALVDFLERNLSSSDIPLGVITGLAHRLAFLYSPGHQEGGAKMRIHLEDISASLGAG
jgi:ABC-type Fe3+-siderophore transport system permease subunit